MGKFGKCNDDNCRAFTGKVNQDICPACRAIRRTNEDKLFRVDGFGEAGSSNMYAFVPFPGFKHWQDLEVGEFSEGYLSNPMSDKKPERITRTK